MPETDMRVIEKEIQKFFSQGVRNKFPSYLDDQLRQAESLFQTYCLNHEEKEHVSRQSVAGFYSLCQLAFTELIVRQQVAEGNLLDIACDKLREAGFDLSDDILPPAFCNALPQVKRALYGQKSTLGGVCLAYLLTARREELVSVASRSPKLIEDIAQLIKLRRHIQGQILVQEANAIRTSIYNDCNALFGG